MIWLDVGLLLLQCGFIVEWSGLVLRTPHCFLQLSSASVVDFCLCWFLPVAGLVLSSPCSTCMHIHPGSLPSTVHMPSTHGPGSLLGCCRGDAQRETLFSIPCNKS